MVDIARLKDRIEFLRANPQAHHQDVWIAPVDDVKVQIPGNGDVCNTGCCLAGWDLLLDHTKYELSAPSTYRRTIVAKRNGEHIEDDEISDRAAEHLGLAEEEAAVLFHGDNTLEHLSDMLDDFKRGTFSPDDSRWPYNH